MEKIKNIGFFLIGLGVCIFACKGNFNPPPAPTAVLAPTVIEGHNYQLIQLGEMARHQHMIDTKTGRIWTKVCMGEFKNIGECSGPTVWQEMYVDGITPVASPLGQAYIEGLKQIYAAKK